MTDFDNNNNNNNSNNNVPKIVNLEEHKNSINYFNYLNGSCVAVERYTPIGLLTVIVNPNFTTETNIQPYFVVAKELVDKLGYSGVDKIKQLLGASEIKIATLAILNGIKDLRECLGVDEIAPRGMMLISEPGLYRILQHSNKPEAVEFRNNVNSIILPNIRQYGSYSSNESFLSHQLNGLEVENQKILERLVVQDNMISEINNVLIHLSSQFDTISDIKPILEQLLDKDSKKAPSTVSVIGVNKKEMLGGIDVESFASYINRTYNRNYSRNVIYNILRQLNYIEQSSTEPTRYAYSNGFVELFAGYIEYQDGSRSKTVKTVLTQKTVDVVINYMKGKCYI